MALLIPTLAGGSPAFRVPSLSAGVGGAALTWVPITAADITATRDTSALEDNAPVDVAGGKLRMRATSSATQVGASNGVTYSIALPGGVADGSNGRLLIRITLDAVLPTPWHLHMGLYSAANVWALTAGVRWVNATSKMRPVAGVLAARGIPVLLADAADTVVNVICAAMATYSVAVAARPADEGHPYGYGKAEPLSAAVEGALVVIAAMVIVIEVIRHIILAPQLEHEARWRLLLSRPHLPKAGAQSHDEGVVAAPAKLHPLDDAAGQGLRRQ